MNYYKQVWYPDLQPRRPPLSVTLHTDSFVKAEGTDVQIRDWLIAEGQHTNHKDGRKYIDLIVTAARGRQNVEWVSELPRLESIGTPMGFESNPYFLGNLYPASLREDWEQVRTRDQPSAARLDLWLHEVEKRLLFVTLDAELLARARDPNSSRMRTTLILSPSQAQRYIDLYLKAFGVYQADATHLYNRGLYYRRRFQTSVSTFQQVFMYAQHLPRAAEIQEFLQSLQSRVMAQMKAYDRIGWLRHSPPNNDTQDEILDLLNYFIILTTSICDSLAWLAAHRFEVYPLNEMEKNKHKITLQDRQRRRNYETFFEALARKAPDLVAYLSTPDVQNKIGLFYGPRDSIQHRLLPKGVLFISEQHVIDCSVVSLNNEDAENIRRVDSYDAENDPFSLWGIWGLTPNDTYLEPYSFTRMALRFLLQFIDEVLKLFDFSSHMNSHLDLKAEADEFISQHSFKRSFAVPFP